MTYDVQNLPFKTLLPRVAVAEDQLARLDEIVRRSPVGEGFAERGHFLDAAANKWISGELLHIEDLVFHDAHMDIRSPTHELVIGHGILRARRRVASAKPGWAESEAGIAALTGAERITSSIASGVAAERGREGADEPPDEDDDPRLCRKLLHEIGCGMMAAPHCGSRSMFKGRHFDRSVILLCVRWYLAYSLSLRDLEEMLTERGVSVDHSTIHRWVEHFSPRLLERFNRRKRAVTGKWHVDETYIKVRGRWMYQYRAIDSVGDTVEFWFSEHRDLPAAKRFLRKALARHGRPDRIVIDGSQTNREAIIACDTESRLLDRPRRPLKRIGIRQSQSLNNRIEQDPRRIKRRARPMLGFKSFGSAAITLAGIEMVQMMRKRQGRFAFNPAPTLKEQFEAIAA